MVQLQIQVIFHPFKLEYLTSFLTLHENQLYGHVQQQLEVCMCMCIFGSAHVMWLI